MFVVLTGHGSNIPSFFSQLTINKSTKEEMITVQRTRFKTEGLQLRTTYIATGPEIMAFGKSWVR